MKNEEYLEKIKDNDLRVHLIQNLDEESSIRYRKIVALGIIAETLIKIDKEGIWIFDGDKGSRK